MRKLYVVARYIWAFNGLMFIALVVPLVAASMDPPPGQSLTERIVCLVRTFQGCDPQLATARVFARSLDLPTDGTLDFARIEIEPPFEGLVQNVHVVQGQRIGPGSSLLELDITSQEQALVALKLEREQTLARYLVAKERAFQALSGANRRTEGVVTPAIGIEAIGAPKDALQPLTLVLTQDEQTMTSPAISAATAAMDQPVDQNDETGIVRLVGLGSPSGPDSTVEFPTDGLDQRIGQLEKVLASRTIRSPIHAIVSNVGVSRGQSIKPGVSSITLIDPTEQELRFIVSVTDAGEIDIGERFGFWLRTDESIKGEAQVLSVLPDSNDRAQVVARVLKPIGSKVSGRAIAALLPGKRHQVALVPREALVNDQVGPGLYVVVNGIVRRIAVRTGSEREGYIEVVDALENADQFVLNPEATWDGAAIRTH